MVRGKGGGEIARREMCGRLRGGGRRERGEIVKKGSDDGEGDRGGK